MLHKHPSAEKAQVYFGITEKLKHDAANFFIYIQPKMGQIYDSSLYRALGEHHNLHDIRDKHLTHLSTLLTGGIDHRFIDESHRIRKIYADQGVTTGEYIKLYQLIISYLSGEAHKKHWWRYKKYRDLNRAIRNLLLFDLAIGTSPNKVESSTTNISKVSEMPAQTRLLIDESEAFKATLEELGELVENSHTIINECYQALQAVLDLINNSNASTLKSNEVTSSKQSSLFSNDPEHNLDLLKSPSNNNDLNFNKTLSVALNKVRHISKIISTQKDDRDAHHLNTLEKMLNEVQEDIEKISTMDILQIPQILSKSNAPSDNTLHSLLQKSSNMIGSQLNNLEDLKARKLSLK